ncbi:hypothetical protein [Bradyrhizobium sp.]|jgi:hypothetical protein|uniref:hypothetical protein n=1 Tax=Bradyrhizobium sp. TaxID=376 RepID=UPI003C570F29
MRTMAILPLVTLCLAPTKTFAAPAYLLNKTITVSVTTTASFVANGRQTTGRRNTTFTIYISTQGRIFSRRVRQVGSASETGEAATPTGVNMRFEGEKLVGVAQYVSGAGRMVVSFDSIGQSCTANFLYGRDNGRPMSWKGLDGVTRTATSPWVASNVTCSIAAGNAFAG